MAGSSSDPAVTGPAAFAAVQEHNREDTINKQAAEIQGLKRKVEELNREVLKALLDHSDTSRKAVKLRTRMLHFSDKMDAGFRDQDQRRAHMAELEHRILEIAPMEWDDSSEEGEEQNEEEQGEQEAQQEQGEQEAQQEQ